MNINKKFTINVNIGVLKRNTLSVPLTMEINEHMKDKKVRDEFDIRTA